MLSPSQYVQEICWNVQKYVKENLGVRWKLPKQTPNPFTMGYAPELYASPMLDPSLASYYQSQIVYFRWTVELGRVDIHTEALMLGSCLALPREGSLEALLYVYGYLCAKHNTSLALDPSYPDIDEIQFLQCDWKEFYGNVKEAVSPDAPEPCGKEVDLCMYVYSDHAGYKETRRSRTGFLIYMNKALVRWLSKKKHTIDTSLFRAKFVTMEIGMGKLRGLMYKLNMMGIPLSCPSLKYGDNMSVIHNT